MKTEKKVDLSNVVLRTGRYLCEMYFIKPDSVSDGKHTVTKGGIVLPEAIAKAQGKIVYSEHPVVAKIVAKSTDAEFNVSDCILLPMHITERMSKDPNTLEYVRINSDGYYVVNEGTVSIALQNYDLSKYKKMGAE